MNRSLAPYIQAIRGPVLLMVVGLLFAIHQSGALPFTRSWPLLIIVLGVIKLIERTVNPTPPLPTQGGSAR